MSPKRRPSHRPAPRNDASWVKCGIMTAVLINQILDYSAIAIMGGAATAADVADKLVRPASEICWRAQGRRTPHAEHGTVRHKHRPFWGLRHLEVAPLPQDPVQISFRSIIYTSRLTSAVARSQIVNDRPSQPGREETRPADAWCAQPENRPAPLLQVRRNHSKNNMSSNVYISSDTIMGDLPNTADMAPKLSTFGGYDTVSQNKSKHNRYVSAFCRVCQRSGWEFFEIGLPYLNAKHICVRL